MGLMRWQASKIARERFEWRQCLIAATASNCWFGTAALAWIRAASRSSSRLSTRQKRTAWASVLRSAAQSSKVTKDSSGRWPTTGRAPHSVSPSPAPGTLRPIQLPSLMQNHRLERTYVEQSGVERAMGIEPTAQAWEAWVLPLYDARLGRS